MIKYFRRRQTTDIDFEECIVSIKRLKIDTENYFNATTQPITEKNLMRNEKKNYVP